MTNKRVALVLSLFALGVAGCGGDDEEDVGTVTVPELSVPGDTTATDDFLTDTTVETVPEVEPAPTPTPTPAPTPTPTPAPTPDSPENDTPPPAGSEAEQFENFCAENPGAC